MKNKFKSYSFWMSVTAAVILVINNIGKVCGFVIDSVIVTQIVDSICGVLILFGVITITKKDDKENVQGEEENIDTKEIQDEKIINDNTLENKANKLSKIDDDATKKYSMNKLNKNKDD